MKFRHGKFKEGVYKIGDYDEEVGLLENGVGFMPSSRLNVAPKPAFRSSAS